MLELLKGPQMPPGAASWPSSGHGVSRGKLYDYPVNCHCLGKPICKLRNEGDTMRNSGALR